MVRLDSFPKRGERIWSVAGRYPMARRLKRATVLGTETRGNLVFSPRNRFTRGLLFFFVEIDAIGGVRAFGQSSTGPARLLEPARSSPCTRQPRNQAGSIRTPVNCELALKKKSG